MTNRWHYSDKEGVDKMDRETAMVENIVVLICFTALAIVFDKWWIVFFSILVMALMRTI